MVREFTCLRITTSRILQLDGVNSMEKIIKEEQLEVTSIQEIMAVIVTLIAEALGNQFHFLDEETKTDG